MQFPARYLDFLFHFHGDRDYFECHEVLEDHWKDNGMERNSIWVGLIQVAVTFYHYRRGNIKGALKMIDKALIQLKDKQEETYSLGIQFSVLIDELAKIRLKIITNQPYKSYHIPIYNPTLLHLCQARCEEAGFPWGVTSTSVSQTIVNRHLTRDRSQVIEEREQALATKNASRSFLLTS
ncbi:DUF309 domain-containing protein [Lederbergia lenta]|uniref:SMC interacting protein n=1 Tax=Lederbergia lenta TaxID=1467 RepID=A0A2X4Z757_LEDLE|nr:DUF309 domain-containing protein [Lederbergia lenta]MCM3111571.1 DUF309 domain-containing protein [Lederbergia lenta]MEC2325041.1 DUF309 domain-containing protein [Lederbergia lenta]SQI56464.1 SMC interacting protein [Lederbergia lenta]